MYNYHSIQHQSASTCTRHATMATRRNLQSMQQSERRNYANRHHLHYVKSSRRINATFSFTLPLSPIRVCSGTHCAHSGLSHAIGGHFRPRLRCSIYLVSIKTYMAQANQFVSIVVDCSWCTKILNQTKIYLHEIRRML